MINKRGSGILLHITSLPSEFGIGDFGPSAYKFADFLKETRQKYWQILPLTPTDGIYYNSPYHSISAFACNPLLVSPQFLIEEGLLKADSDMPSFPSEKVDYHNVTLYKEKIYQRIANQLKRKVKNKDATDFFSKNSAWLDDYAFFIALKKNFKDKVWTEWPQDIRDRKKEALKKWGLKLKEDILQEKAIQYILLKQWARLKSYCNNNGIRIIGDIPIYVDHNSADAWVNPDIFKLDEKNEPYAVAGVPPDYFSKTGQLWGNPVYNWEILKKTGYDWWIKRLKHVCSLYDIVRIDHFRGLVAYWEVPADEKTAINGKWVKAPAEDFFNNALKKIKDFPIIAEDLGIITPDVVDIMKRFGFPGMKVLLFAFGGKPADNPYLPHNHVKNCVMYTGTHDNNTARGWFEHDATEEEKENLCRYLGRRISPEDISWELIRIAMYSVADTVILPMQDILSLGSESRMNHPSVAPNNWEWRIPTTEIGHALKTRLKDWTEMYGRA